MEKNRRIICSITDLMAQDDQYTTDYLKKRKIDHEAFRVRMLEEAERRKKGGRPGRSALRPKD